MYFDRKGFSLGGGLRVDAERDFEDLKGVKSGM